jgi:hypothetical protein
MPSAQTPTPIPNGVSENGEIIKRLQISPHRRERRNERKRLE